MNAIKISGNDFLDILFEGRNKEYGAYDLRRKYNKRLRNAIAGTAAVALIFVGGYVISNRLSTSETHIRSRPIVPETVLRDLQPLEKKPPSPSIPPVQPPAVRPTIKLTTPVIKNDDEVSPEEAPPRMDEIGTKAISTTTAAGVEDGIDPGLLTESKGTGVVEAPKAEDKEKVHTYVEIMPSFPGGDAALAKFLKDNIRYPSVAAENGISGMVIVQFIVDHEGNIRGIKIASGRKGGGLEEEAGRVVKLMPKWKPGKQNGQAVTVQFNLPVNFRLE